MTSDHCLRSGHLSSSGTGRSPHQQEMGKRIGTQESRPITNSNSQQPGEEKLIILTFPRRRVRESEESPTEGSGSTFRDVSESVPERLRKEGVSQAACKRGHRRKGLAGTPASHTPGLQKAGHRVRVLLNMTWLRAGACHGCRG